MKQHELNPDAPTWQALARAEPSLRQFERSAGEAGRNGLRGWLGWVIHFGNYVALFDERFCPPIMATHAAWDCVLDHLGDVYHEGQRQAQQAAQRAAQQRTKGRA